MRILKSHENSYTVGRESPIEYIAIHHTSIIGDSAEMNAKFFNQREAENKVSYHYFIDEKEIINSVDDNDTAYFMADSVLYKNFTHYGCRSENSISIILCNVFDKYGNSNVTNKFSNLRVLLDSLIEKYDIPNEKILSFKDVRGEKEKTRMDDEFKEFMKKIKGEM